MSPDYFCHKEQFDDDDNEDDDDDPVIHYPIIISNKSYAPYG